MPGSTLERRAKMVALALGVLLLGYTTSGLFRNRTFLMGASEAVGSVFALRKVDGKSDVPVVRFNARDGSVVTWIALGEQASRLRRIGETVDVLYMPDQPGAVMVGSFFMVLLKLLLPGVAGLVLIACGRSILRYGA